MFLKILTGEPRIPPCDHKSSQIGSKEHRHDKGGKERDSPGEDTNLHCIPAPPDEDLHSHHINQRVLIDLSENVLDIYYFRYTFQKYRSSNF